MLFNDEDIHLWEVVKIYLGSRVGRMWKVLWEVEKIYLESSVGKNWKVVLILLNIFIFLEDEK